MKINIKKQTWMRGDLFSKEGEVYIMGLINNDSLFVLINLQTGNSYRQPGDDPFGNRFDCFTFVGRIEIEI